MIHRITELFACCQLSPAENNMDGRPAQQRNNRSSRTLADTTGCFLPASPVSPDAENSCVPLEVMELANIALLLEEGNASSCSMQSCCHQKGSRWLLSLGWGWEMALEVGTGRSPILIVHREPGSSPAMCLQVF